MKVALAPVADAPQQADIAGGQSPGDCAPGSATAASLVRDGAKPSHSGDVIEPCSLRLKHPLECMPHRPQPGPAWSPARRKGRDRRDAGRPRPIDRPERHDMHLVAARKLGAVRVNFRYAAFQAMMAAHSEKAGRDQFFEGPHETYGFRLHEIQPLYLDLQYQPLELAWHTAAGVRHWMTFDWGVETEDGRIVFGEDKASEDYFDDPDLAERLDFAEAFLAEHGASLERRVAGGLPTRLQRNVVRHIFNARRTEFDDDAVARVLRLVHAAGGTAPLGQVLQAIGGHSALSLDVARAMMHRRVLSMPVTMPPMPEALGDGILRFRYVDGDEEIVLVPVGRGAERAMPTVPWIIAQFRAGVVCDPDYSAHTSERGERNLHLDRAACESIDPKSGWKFDWADAALRAAITKTEDDARVWIAENDLGGRKPQPRSLLRWMRKLVLHGGRIGALVSTAGREKGQTQLADVEDRLVHKWAMRYWRPNLLNGRLAHKEDAAAMVQADWDVLKEMGIPHLGEEAPSAETVRQRINDMECYSTYASRHGRPAADRKFSPAGEPVEVDQPFERIFMDGVEWEHSVFYSDELRIPAAKMKSGIAMDAFSQFIFPHPTFAGQFRPQWGLRALMGVMLPPEMTVEEVAENPELAMIYSLPSDVMYDRDRTMIPPRSVPGAIKLFATAELAEAYHHDAKGKLENYHKFVKQSLAKIPGRILGPRIKHDIGYDPLKATEVTRAQYIDLIEQCRLDWNKKQKKSLGDRSPNDIMRAFLKSGGARLTDPKEVRRTFASVPKKPCVLTVNGLTHDNAHYRFNRDGVGKTLSSNHHATPFAKRLEGTVRLEVRIRVWDDDIDMIEVYDEENREYVPMWSTDPGYTGRLSRWEHHVYQKALRKGQLGATGKRDRLRAKAKTLEQRQKTLTGKSFREREEVVELLEAEERRLSGKRGANPACAQVPELGIPTTVDDTTRGDIPTAPPQTREEAKAERPEELDDVRSDPSKNIAEELGDADKILKHSWIFSDDAADDDNEDEDEDEGEED